MNITNEGTLTNMCSSNFLLVKVLVGQIFMTNRKPWLVTLTNEGTHQLLPIRTFYKNTNTT